MVVELSRGGPDVVLVHGSPQPPSELRPLAARLVSRFRCLLVQLPNYEDAPPGPSEPSEVHDHVARELVEANARAPIYIGFSSGFWRSVFLATHPRTWLE